MSTSPSGSRPLPRVIAIANQKGGVGKTTTTINLGACLAELGYRTLIVDLDPQGNASTGLGIENRGLETSMYDVLMHEAPLENCVEPTAIKGLFIAPASLDLAGAEIELVSIIGRESLLKNAIQGVINDYDYVLIDCPDSVRVLRPGRPRSVAAQRRPRQAQAQPVAGSQHDRLRHVRRSHQAGRPGGAGSP